MTNNNIITDSTIKETKIYRANFDRYLRSGGNVSLNFIKVQDEEGNIVKKSFTIGAAKAMGLVGNLLPGQLITFSARIITDADYLDGFDFADVSFFGFN